MAGMRARNEHRTSEAMLGVVRYMSRKLARGQAGSSVNHQLSTSEAVLGCAI